MIIKREKYLKQLVESCGNGMIKVVTGVRRCGKSFLLFKLFRNYLMEQGVDDEHIIEVDLENRLNKKFRDPDALLEHIMSRIKDERKYFILLDEVQLVSEFEDVLNSFLKMENTDVFVTGSNARFLSKDVITEFRGRGDEIRIHPLSFKEFAEFKGSYSDAVVREYMLYGGLPQVAIEQSIEKKENYLKQQFASTYLRDIKERHKIQNDNDLSELVDVMASCIGSLTNPSRIANTFISVKHSKVSVNTVRKYIEYMEDAFLIEKTVRYDVKGRQYIDSPFKYYFEDLGLRNARLGFRQAEQTHLMENLLYNELRGIGFNIDVGQVYTTTNNGDGMHKKSTLEIDFVCNKGYNRIYVQSAFTIDSLEKTEQELSSLKNLKDGFRKIVIVGGLQPTYINEDGIYIVNLTDFLQSPERFLSL